MKRLPVTLANAHWDYLRGIKLRHKISMSAQIRGLIKDRMEGRTLTIETRSKSRPIYSKRGDERHMPALNKEFRELLARRKSKT